MGDFEVSHFLRKKLFGIYWKFWVIFIPTSAHTDQNQAIITYFERGHCTADLMFDWFAFHLT